METNTAENLEQTPEIVPKKTSDTPKELKKVDTPQTQADPRDPGYYRMKKKIGDIRRSTEEKIHTARGKIDTFMQKALRFEEPEYPNQEPILLPPKAPVYMVGDAADATLLTPARRGWEITNTMGTIGRAIYRTFTRPIPGFHAKETLRHPLQYAANPARLMTSTAKQATNLLNAIPRSLDEFVNRGITRPTQRLEKIPLIGGLISKVGKGLGWLAKKPRQLFDWITKPIERADDWVKSKQ